MTTRQQVNETAANVAKMLTMMIRMPDEQVDYLFNKEFIQRMHDFSEDIITRVEGMIGYAGDWHPGCGEQVEGRESALRRLYGDNDETQ